MSVNVHKSSTDRRSRAVGAEVTGRAAARGRPRGAVRLGACGILLDGVGRAGPSTSARPASDRACRRQGRHRAGFGIGRGRGGGLRGQRAVSAAIGTIGAACAPAGEVSASPAARATTGRRPRAARNAGDSHTARPWTSSFTLRSIHFHTPAGHVGSVRPARGRGRAQPPPSRRSLEGFGVERGRATGSLRSSRRPPPPGTAPARRLRRPRPPRPSPARGRAAPRRPRRPRPHPGSARRSDASSLTTSTARPRGRQRRGGGAEVVDGHGEPRRLQAHERAAQLVGIEPPGLLGHFEVQQAGRKPPLARRASRHRAEGIEKRRARQVRRHGNHGDRRLSRRAGGRGRARRCGGRGRQAGLLQERRGARQARRVAPARKRLGAAPRAHSKTGWKAGAGRPRPWRRRGIEASW